MSATHPVYLGGHSSASNTSTTTHSMSSVTWDDDLDARSIVLLQSTTPSGAEVSSISGTNQFAGTWSRVGRFDGGAEQGMEIWMGYNFQPYSGTASGDVNLTYSVAVTKKMIRLTGWRFTGANTVAPVIVGVPAGAGGTGTTADPVGTITPAVGDLLIQAHYHEANSAPTAYTDTGGSFAHHGSASNSTSPIAYRHETAFRVATSAVAHKRVVTHASAVWVELLACIRPLYDTTNEVGHVYKGRDLQSLDTEGAT